MLEFNARHTKIALDDRGFFASISVCGKELVAGDYPFLTVCRDDKLYMPEKAVKNGDTITFTTAIGDVCVKFAESDVCVSFEVTSVPAETYAVVFGPFAVNIDEVVGDVIGVVQGNGVAFGAQTLNIKTLEGVPHEYAEQVFALSEYSGDSTNITTGGMAPTERAATRINGGTVLHFFCKRRDIVEYRTVNNVEKSLVIPLKKGDPDAVIPGAAIAFFGCCQKDALSRMGEIELEKGLPHPMFGGEWGKTARAAMESYLISDFGAEDYDFVVEKAKVADLKYIYQEGPQKNWGHFEWSDSFGTDADVRALVDRSEKQGVHLGVHTLTNFTTTNDPYVSPVPSKHLLKMCELKLALDIDATQTEISFEQTEYFKYPLTLNTVQAGDELIRCGEYVNENGKTTVKNCERGAFGTAASAHTTSETLYRLWDYPYNTLFPDIELQDAYSDRIAELFNNCNLSQISFDGLEGCSYTGHDLYAPTRFANRCWQKWDHNVLNDGSGLHHFNWHMNTRMNWGEPWGEAMRTGQVDGRIKNQAFYRRNLFPRMLGWFLIRLADKKFECSTLEDLEWALSEAAGFDGGYAMTIRVNTLKKHGKIDSLLTAMKDWDTLRLKNAFTDAQMEKLRDPATEWHLEKLTDTSYLLYPLSVSKHYTCSLSEMQPGQTGGSDWTVENIFGGKAAVRMKIEGDGSIKNPIIKTAGGTIKFPCEIEDGQYLLYGFDGKAEITDKNFKTISEVIPQGELIIPQGSTALAFACDHDKDSEPDISVRFIMRGEPDTITI